MLTLFILIINYVLFIFRLYYSKILKKEMIKKMFQQRNPIVINKLQQQKQKDLKGKQSLQQSSKTFSHQVRVITQQKKALKPILIQQKMQNVSCLYSNFMYKNNQKNFIQDMKLQRYRLLLQNQRMQKLCLQKQNSQLKQQISCNHQQKQTLMFAYRTLQTKMKDKQKFLKQKLKQNSQKSQLTIQNLLKSQGSFHSILLSSKVDIDHQIKNDKVYQQDFGYDLNTIIKNNVNRMANSKVISKYLQNQDGVDILEDRQVKFQILQFQISKYKDKIKNNQQKMTKISALNSKLQSDLKKTDDMIKKQTEQLQSQVQTLTNQSQTILNLQQQINLAESKYSQISLLYIDQTKQSQLKQQIIKQLSQQNYSFVEKQKHQQQQILLLSTFTKSLQLQDQKIKEYIQSNFQIAKPISQVKCFKQDLAYILHLVKKKQLLYNQLIREYQQKMRQTEMRCFIGEKMIKMMEYFVNKLQLYLKKEQNAKDHTEIHAASISRLVSIIEAYYLDKRILKIM